MNGFSGIIDVDFSIKWSAPEFNSLDASHSPIFSYGGVVENSDAFVRRFVRFEFPKWTEDSFKFDEVGTLPGWVEENKQEIIDRATKVMLKVKPLSKKLKEMHSKVDNGEKFADLVKLADNLYSRIPGYIPARCVDESPF